MITKQATKQEFEQAFYFIERLWDYNVYDKEAVRNVYKEILADENSFAFSCVTKTESIAVFAMEASF